MNDTDTQAADKIQYEREVLLSEYKMHHEEIFKWNTFTNQLIVGYLALLSAVVTINAKSDSPIPWFAISIFAQYISFALLFAVFQFKFAIVSHQKYIEKNIRERFLEVCGSDTLLDWESFFIKRRTTSSVGMKWLTKFGFNIAPYSIIFFASILNLILLIIQNEDTVNLWNGCVLSVVYILLAVLVPLGLLICFLFGFKHLSKDERSGKDNAK